MEKAWRWRMIVAAGIAVAVLAAGGFGDCGGGGDGGREETIEQATTAEDESSGQVTAAGSATDSAVSRSGGEARGRARVVIPPGTRIETRGEPVVIEIEVEASDTAEAGAARTEAETLAVEHESMRRVTAAQRVERERGNGGLRVGGGIWKGLVHGPAVAVEAGLPVFGRAGVCAGAVFAGFGMPERIYGGVRFAVIELAGVEAAVSGVTAVETGRWSGWSAGVTATICFDL